MSITQRPEARSRRDVQLFFSSSSPSTARGRSCLRACGGMLNLDTHVLLHALTGDLTRRESALLAHDTWSISAIVLWEIAKLARLGRIAIDLDDPELADEIIASTSLAHRVPLVTRDARIRKSRVVPLVHSDA